MTMYKGTETSNITSDFSDFFRLDRLLDNFKSPKSCKKIKKSMIFIDSGKLVLIHLLTDIFHI